jgi:hypothetical protein
LPRLVSPQQSSNSSLSIQKHDELLQTLSGENISRKRHITPDRSLKKKLKETYNRALTEGLAEGNSANHFNHSYQSHDAFTTPSKPNLPPLNLNLEYGYFDHYYYDV